MKGFKLRRATDADIPALASVIAVAFEVYRDKLVPPSSSLSKIPEAVRLELQTATAIVAEQNRTLIGCVFYQVFYQAKNDHVYLSRLAVLPDHQGKGNARALLTAGKPKPQQRGQVAFAGAPRPETQPRSVRVVWLQSLQLRQPRGLRGSYLRDARETSGPKLLNKATTAVF